MLLCCCGIGTLVKEDHLLDFATLGSYLELDLFGNEVCSFVPSNVQVDSDYEQFFNCE